MPIPIIVLIAILIAQIGFWDTLGCEGLRRTRTFARVGELLNAI